MEGYAAPRVTRPVCAQPTTRPKATCEATYQGTGCTRRCILPWPTVRAWTASEPSLSPNRPLHPLTYPYKHCRRPVHPRRGI
jgi:hypothetical protein